jgi:peptidyl-dipeptidase Dcp
MTNVLRDFVELPSQLLEHWLRTTTVVLQAHAKHVDTQEAISTEMLAKLSASRNFNQGFATVEYSICALLDQRLHSLPKGELETLEISRFEEQELQRLQMPQGICMRHRPAHFLHLFSSSSYAAAYYVYLWAEVLDADAFDAFTEAGNVFDQAVAARLRAHIYSAGNMQDPADAFRAFRGRDAAVEPMLRKKGLLASVI